MKYKVLLIESDSTREVEVSNVKHVMTDENYVYLKDVEYKTMLVSPKDKIVFIERVDE